VLVVQGTLPAALVYLTRPLVDALAVFVQGGPESILDAGPLVSLGSLFVGLLVLGQALDALGGYIRTAQGEQVQTHLHDLVHRQSVALDLAFYDTVAFYDKLHQSRDESFHRPVLLLEHLGGLLQHGVTLGALALVLLPYGAWVPAALVVSALPALQVILRHNRRRHTWWLASTPRERRAWYCSWVLTARETAMDLRLLGLGGHYRRAYRALRTSLRQERLALARAQGLAEAGAGLVGTAITVGALAWMLWRALHGHASLGDIALFQQAFQRGQGIIGGLLRSAGQVYANSLFLRNLFEFLDLKPGVQDPLRPVPVPDPVTIGIQCRSLRFRYPGADRDLFAGLDLDIPAGSITAILGGNGAGKTTLIKLLCRLYDPQDGFVALDGVNLCEMGQADLRGRIAVLSQDPVRYSASVAECISLGDINLLGTDTGQAACESAARAAEAHGFIDRLPQGYATPLGAWLEGGTDLSGGQWQRLALARTLIRRTPILILDEPTSALDPWAEARWLAGFRSLVRGRTVLLITHRLTAASLADHIHVMEGGQLLESGSHTDLLRHNGPYAAAWRAADRTGTAGLE
jgi:ATP-binding cassette subfamily B protein